MRDQLSDPRTFTAELSPTGFTTSENQNLATVLPKAGGIYSLQVLAKTPGSFAPLISLGTGSTDAEDATPHITINITITCPEPFIQSDGQCVCPAGQESTGGTGADASGCQPCDVGFAKPLPGNELCAPCAEGTYTNLGGQAACTDCLLVLSHTAHHCQRILHACLRTRPVLNCCGWATTLVDLCGVGCVIAGMKSSPRSPCRCACTLGRPIA